MSDFGKIRDMCIATHLHALVYRSSVVATTNDSMPPHIQPKWAIKTIFIEVNWKFIQNDTIKNICKAELKVVYFDDQKWAFIESGKGLSGPN